MRTIKRLITNIGKWRKAHRIKVLEAPMPRLAPVVPMPPSHGSCQDHYEISAPYRVVLCAGQWSCECNAAPGLCSHILAVRAMRTNTPLQEGIRAAVICDLLQGVQETLSQMTGGLQASEPGEGSGAKGRKPVAEHQTVLPQTTK